MLQFGQLSKLGRNHLNQIASKIQLLQINEIFDLSGDLLDSIVTANYRPQLLLL